MAKKVKVKGGRLLSEIGDEFGAVNPLPFATLIPGAILTEDKLNGDELALPPNTILTGADSWLTVGEVDALMAGTQDVRLLFISRTGWRPPVYDVGGDNVTKATCGNTLGQTLKRNSTTSPSAMT